MHQMKTWGVRVAVVFGAMLWLALVASTWADAAHAAQGTDEGEEYNFNWLDPEKKIYVLQNRKFLKANRVLLSVLTGPGLSNPYRTAFNVDGRFSYYFREDWGLEVFYAKSLNSQNNTFKALVNTATTTKPVIREIGSEYGALVHWVPWYSKINVFNKILYFDWYFSGGAGTLQTSVDTTSANSPFTSQELFALFAGTGHQYHVTRSLTVRLDFMGAFYRAPIFGTAGEEVWYSNYNFGVGLGWRI